MSGPKYRGRIFLLSAFSIAVFRTKTRSPSLKSNFVRSEHVLVRNERQLLVGRCVPCHGIPPIGIFVSGEL